VSRVRVPRYLGRGRRTRACKRATCGLFPVRFFFPSEVHSAPCTTTEFRFGRIVHIHAEDERVHMQWFDHARNTFLDDIADPRELFLTPVGSGGYREDVAQSTVRHPPDNHPLRYHPGL